MRPSIHVRFTVKELTSSPLAGSKAHCQELTKILYAETSLNEDSRIPTVLRRNPRLFFQVFEQERKKKRADAVAAPGGSGVASRSMVAVPGTLGAAPDSGCDGQGSRLTARAEGQGDGDDTVFVKVSVTKNGVTLKTKSIPFCTSFQQMTTNVKHAFSLPASTTFMLYYMDQAKAQILWFLFVFDTNKLWSAFGLSGGILNRVKAGFQIMCRNGLFDWAFC